MGLNKKKNASNCFEKASKIDPNCSLALNFKGKPKKN